MTAGAGDLEQDHSGSSLLALLVDELHEMSAVLCVLAYRVTALEGLALKRGLATPEELLAYRRAVVVDRQTEILREGSGLDDVQGNR